MLLVDAFAKRAVLDSKYDETGVCFKYRFLPKKNAENFPQEEKPGMNAKRWTKKTKNEKKSMLLKKHEIYLRGNHSSQVVTCRISWKKREKVKIRRSYS